MTGDPFALSGQVSQPFRAMVDMGSCFYLSRKVGCINMKAISSESDLSRPKSDSGLIAKETAREGIAREGMA